MLRCGTFMRSSGWGRCEMRRIPLIQFGVGNVGRALIEQVTANRARHGDLLGLRLEYVALADRDGAVVDDADLVMLVRTDRRAEVVAQTDDRRVQTRIGVGAFRRQAELVGKR